MAKCEVCSKGLTFGKNVSHSNRKTSRTVKPNLQSVKVNNEGTVKSVKVCARCLKSGKVERAV
ncbi:MAG: 50S ribosomal protein L28 [Clostridia bacterium]|nr:50S ribosomal protein L28 [Clostridia bacterium]